MGRYKSFHIPEYQFVHQNPKDDSSELHMAQGMDTELQDYSGSTREMTDVKRQTQVRRASLHVTFCQLDLAESLDQE